MMEIEAAVAMCKCKKVHKMFGIRFEKSKSDQWKYTWAFPIKEDVAKREGYDETLIKGMVYPEHGYRGCPYCGERMFVVCNCGKLNCKILDPITNEFECQWCGLKSMELFDYKGDGIYTGSDR